MAVNDDATIGEEVAVLRAEHRLLDERICGLIDSGAGDQMELARLKRRKLRLKDQIQVLLDRSVPDIIA